MKRLAIPLLAAALLVGGIGCSKASGISDTTVKAIFQSAATSLEAALTLLNVKWASATFDTDVNNTIAAWGIGATWKQQVVNLLGPVSKDVSQIACGSNTKCQGLVTIFQGAVQSVITDLGGTTKSSARKLPHYATYAEFRDAWDSAAPDGAKL